MNTIFPSKIDWWLFGPLLLILLGISVMTVVDGLYFAPLSMLPALGFIVWLLRRTYYEVEPQTQTLRVVSGPLTWQVPIDKITRVRDSRSVLSSPALSIDRLKISYNHYDELLISPRDKAGFIVALQRLNPQIQVG